MLSLLLTSDALLLLCAAIIVGVVSVVLGGGMFFSVPLMQWLFPEVSLGALIGNIKMGSLFRGIGTIFSTRSHINYRKKVPLGIVALVGTVLGASMIAHIHQRWVVVAMVAAVILAWIAPKLAQYITPRRFVVAAFMLGIYAGIFGAGIGVMLIALLRSKYPCNRDIAYVKIQARFMEFMMVMAAVITHILHGNLITHIWVPWAIGGLLGGCLGGYILRKLGTMPGKFQLSLLHGVYIFAIASSIVIWIANG